MSPFTTTRSKTTQSTSMVRIDLGSMEKKPKEINLGLMVGRTNKGARKRKYLYLKFLGVCSFVVDFNMRNKC